MRLFLHLIACPIEKARAEIREKSNDVAGQKPRGSININVTSFSPERWCRTPFGEDKLFSGHTNEVIIFKINSQVANLQMRIEARNSVLR